MEKRKLRAHLLRAAGSLQDRCWTPNEHSVITSEPMRVFCTESLLDYLLKSFSLIYNKQNISSKQNVLTKCECIMWKACSKTFRMVSHSSLCIRLVGWMRTNDTKSPFGMCFAKSVKQSIKLFLKKLSKTLSKNKLS